MNSSCVAYANSNFFSTSPLVHCRSAPTTLAKPAFRPTTVACLNTQEKTKGWIAPLELKTPAGKLLSDALLEDQDNFLVKARKELVQLAAERDQDEARLKLKVGILEDCLYRRVAKLKKHERQEVAEEVMYTLVLHKFSEIKSPLIPPLPLCLHNNTLKILPAENPELESVYPVEVLEVVNNKINNKLANLDSIFLDFSTRYELYLWYKDCIEYGYFLSSCFWRYQLESSDMDGVKFTEYLERFDGEMKRMCRKPRSKEVAHLENLHMNALFGDDNGEDEMFTVTNEGVMRYVYEGVAFGSFIWEIENWVDGMYFLERI